MSDTRYTEQHEWIAVDGTTGTIGITEFAQEQLGDIVFVELPKVGKSFDQGDQVAVLESVKAAAEVYAPAGGEVVETNDALIDDPAKVNADPEGDAWFFKLILSDPSELDELMDEAAYRTFVEENR